MIIEQLFHGYSDGHRLLGASLDLPRSAKHAILVLSDMSGRSMLPDFEEYLTGYPLLELGYFAFAKTWYAPEMERPGCVWTHTLLINTSDIVRVIDLSCLLQKFRRPNDEQDWGEYSRSIMIETAADASTQPRGIDHDLAKGVLSAMYSIPTAPVLVPVNNPRSQQDLVIALWNQQWPQLRQKFSFCTGSISPRTISGRPFDLQIIPSGAVRQFRREVSGAVIVETNMPAPAHLKDRWLEAATANLLNPTTQWRQEALLRYADGFVSGRDAFIPLVELSFCLEEARKRDNLFEQLIEAVAIRFPNAEQGNLLKSALLGPYPRVTQLLYPETTDVDILYAIATTKHESAFNIEALAIENRIQRLWDSNRGQVEDLIDLLISRNHNIIGERMLATFVSIVPSNEILAYFANKPSLLAAVVRRDPELAASTALWTGPADSQRDLFDAATAGLELGDGLRRRIVMSMLEARSDAPAQQVLGRFGQSIVPMILDWFDAHAPASHAELPSGWYRCLSQHPEVVLEWIVASPNRHVESIGLATGILDPHAAYVHRAGVDVWLAAFSNTQEASNQIRTRLYAFGLALAFDVSLPGSDALAALTFETVHDATAANRQMYEFWHLFEDHVPFLSSWRNWDKCERLRRALIERFEYNQWPTSQFLRCANRYDIFRQLMQTCSDYKPYGKQFLKRMARDKASILDILNRLPHDWTRTFKYYM